MNAMTGPGTARLALPIRAVLWSLIVVLGTGAGLGACGRQSQPDRSVSAAARADRFAPDRNPAALLDSHWFNALVVPLLDDEDHAVWGNHRLAPLCGDDTEVFANGNAVSALTPMPPGQLELRWQFPRCR